MPLSTREPSSVATKWQSRSQLNSSFIRLAVGLELDVGGVCEQGSSFLCFLGIQMRVEIAEPLAYGKKTAQAICYVAFVPCSRTWVVQVLTTVRVVVDRGNRVPRRVAVDISFAAIRSLLPLVAADVGLRLLE